MTAEPTGRFHHPRVAWGEDDLPRREFRRIVSLVPSLSEALVALGLGDRLVGVTVYCVEPRGAFEGLPRVGGTKDADVEAIRALRPDLVIANQEENTERVVRRLADAGITVWVTYPRTVRAGAELLRALARLGAEPAAIDRVVTPVDRALEQAELDRERDRESNRRPPRVFCAIWRDPWMTVGSDTYIHDLITLCGGANVFAEPVESRGGADVRSDTSGARARRYPLVDQAAIERAEPELILLPSEPYAFVEADRRAVLGFDCEAARSGHVVLIDGSLLSWYGPRIAEAIRVLGLLLATR